MLQVIVGSNMNAIKMQNLRFVCVNLGKTVQVRTIVIVKLGRIGNSELKQETEADVMKEEQRT